MSTWCSIFCNKQCILYNLQSFYFILSLSVNAGVHTFPNATFGWVNVKDVANAHIQAFEIPSANGRYCLVEQVAHYSEVVKKLSEVYPDFILPGK